MSRALALSGLAASRASSSAGTSSRRLVVIRMKRPQAVGFDEMRVALDFLRQLLERKIDLARVQTGLDEAAPREKVLPVQRQAFAEEPSSSSEKSRRSMARMPRPL
jgi:hypothetical protein